MSACVSGKPLTDDGGPYYKSVARTKRNCWNAARRQEPACVSIEQALEQNGNAFRVNVSEMRSDFGNWETKRERKERCDRKGLLYSTIGHLWASLLPFRVRRSGSHCIYYEAIQKWSCSNTTGRSNGFRSFSASFAHIPLFGKLPNFQMARRREPWVHRFMCNALKFIQFLHCGSSLLSVNLHVQSIAFNHYIVRFILLSALMSKWKRTLMSGLNHPLKWDFSWVFKLKRNS